MNKILLVLLLLTIIISCKDKQLKKTPENRITKTKQENKKEEIKTKNTIKKTKKTQIKSEKVNINEKEIEKEKEKEKEKRIVRKSANDFKFAKGKKIAIFAIIDNNDRLGTQIIKYRENVINKLIEKDEFKIIDKKSFKNVKKINLASMFAKKT